VRRNTDKCVVLRAGERLRVPVEGAAGSAAYLILKTRSPGVLPSSSTNDDVKMIDSTKMSTRGFKPPGWQFK
jgi:hypothetical protein